MPTLILTTQHLPLGGDPLPAPVEVASITTDTRLVGCINPERVLRTIAAQAGLFHFEIIEGSTREVPGYQYPLFTRQG